MTSAGISGPLSASTRLQHVLRDFDRVRAFALGNGERDGGIERVAVRRTARTVAGSSPPSIDVGDIANVDRLAVRDAGDHVPDVLSAAQELSGLEHELAIAAGVLAGRQTPVGATECAVDLHRREIVCRQAGLVERDAQLAALAADDRHLRYVVHLLDGVMHLRGDAAQFEAAVALAPEA